MTDKPRYRIECVNENSLLIHFGTAIDVKWPAIIAEASQTIHKKLSQYITDIVPSYTTQLICVDTHKISLLSFMQLLNEELQNWQADNRISKDVIRLPTSPLIEIPVFYGAKVAPDLAKVAGYAGLTEAEVIQLHSSKIYTIFTIGFAPGFAYMGVIDKKIAAPRLATPRAQVAAGSVGIAGEQTGIYPRQSPGGWNIIGQTPVNMLQLDENNCLDCPLVAGHRVKFNPIDERQFLALGGSINNV